MKHGQIAEYGQVKSEDFSKVTMLDHFTMVREGCMLDYRLSHHTVGWELAGSVARFNGHVVWSASFHMDGPTIHGRRFPTEKDARDLFLKWTKKEAS